MVVRIESQVEDAKLSIQDAYSMLSTASTATRHLDLDRYSIDLRNRQSELAARCSSVIRVRLEAKTNRVMQKRNELKETEVPPPMPVLRCGPCN